MGNNGVASHVDGDLTKLIRRNLKIARRVKTTELAPIVLERLREMTMTFGFSLPLGDLMFLDGGWYVTHSGLLRLASRRRCVGIEAEEVRQSSDPSTNRWVFKATIFKSLGSRGFTGFGDADPSNVSTLMHGAEMRIAETRAVNRALRKAYDIGLCSVEEMGSSPR